MRKKLTLILTTKRVLSILIFIAFLVCPAGLSYAGKNKTSEALQEGKKQITGKVTDGVSGIPLPGVSILLKGTTEGTITDLDGNFTLKVSDKDVLVFSFIGYISEEMFVGTNTEFSVSLEEDVIGLEEVVVTGYGVQKKSDVTGAIASVSGNDLTKTPVAGIDQALTGRAAGVQVLPNTGAPGAGISIRIRGVSSINGSEPLFIVDGISTSAAAVSALNPNDIESIEVLKDASSQAIYGASGGNGVVLISTKKGSEGKMISNLNYYIGQQSVWKKMDVCNTQEYLQVLEQVDPTNELLDQAATLPNTDWQDEIFRKALMHSLDYSASGGNEVSKYMISGSFLKQDGIVKNNDYRRYTLRANSEHKITKRIKIGENLSFADEYHNGFPEATLRNEYSSPIMDALLFDPFAVPYDSLGNWTTSVLGNEVNPFRTIDIMDDVQKYYRFAGNGFVNIELIKGLTYENRFGGDIWLGDRKTYNPVYFYTVSDQNTQDYLVRYMEKARAWSWQNLLRYQLSVSDNNLELLAGIEAGYSYYENMTLRADMFPNATVQMRYFDVSLDTEYQRLTGRANESSGYSYLGRLNYDYKGKYLLTVNVRRDYSSKFGEKYRHGTFPSFSVGWKFSEESFMKNLTFLSFGKVRFGWGLTGNDKIRDYQYYALTSSQPYYGYAVNNTTSSTGTVPFGIQNSELHWEAMESINAGIDLGFLANRLTLSVDYFTKNNKGMLLDRPLVLEAGNFQRTDTQTQEGGTISMLQNLGRVDNHGIEVAIGYKETRNAFKHSLDLNFTYVKNEVINLDGDSLPSGTARGNRPINYTREGYPIAGFYGYKTDGLFHESDGIWVGDEWLITNQPFAIDEDGDTNYAQPNAQPGDIRFVDVNNDGAITAADQTFIGDPNPHVLIGLSYSAEYKGFDFSIFFQGAFGHKIFNATKITLYNNDGRTNWSTEMLESYSEDNKGATLQRIDPANDNQNLRISDFFVESGNYVRVRSVQLGYTLPKEFTTKINIEKVRIYIGAKNLFTFTKYSGFDPEIGSARRTDGVADDPLNIGIDVASFPQSRMFLAGVNLQF